MSATQQGNGNYSAGVDWYQVYLERAEKMDPGVTRYHILREVKIPDTRTFAHRIGVTKERLNKLSCIHVAGTKGKGSTCALLEKILRTCGYKTGLLSSPPLVEVRERIRVNGLPVARDDFGRYAVKALDRLEEAKGTNEGGTTKFDMPGYFQFLTLLAFHIFIEEEVDVAIIEVGLGGEWDTTNLIWYPTVSGIASLGLDHTDLLGDTVEKIAWHKAGIIKDGRPAFSVRQMAGPLQVVADRAAEKGAPLQVCPVLQDYGFRGNKIKIGLYGKHQYFNSTLAIQLARKWIEEKDPGRFAFRSPVPAHELPEPNPEVEGQEDDPTGGELTFGNVSRAPAFVLPDEFIQGLSSCNWPGRTQVVKRGKVSYYLDNAHTIRSIAFCRDWFEKEGGKEATTIKGCLKRVLLFNMIGCRDAKSIVPPLVDYGFDAAIFCPNRTTSSTANESSDKKDGLTFEGELAKSTGFRDAFAAVVKEKSSTTQNGGKNGSQTVLKVFPSVMESLQWAVGSVGERFTESLPTTVDQDPSNPLKGADHVQVLVCGSTFLVGATIKVLDPTLATGRV